METKKEKYVCKFEYCLVENNIKKLFDSRSKINEHFAAAIIAEAFGFDSAKHGTDKGTPDWLFDEKEWFEITLISDSKRHDNLIQRIKL